jgi:hypothetical protein
MLVPASLELILNAMDTFDAVLAGTKCGRGAERRGLLERLLEMEILEAKAAGKASIESTETAIWLCTETTTKRDGY